MCCSIQKEQTRAHEASRRYEVAEKREKITESFSMFLLLKMQMSKPLIFYKKQYQFPFMQLTRLVPRLPVLAIVALVTPSLPVVKYITLINT